MRAIFLATLLLHSSQAFSQPAEADPERWDSMSSAERLVVAANVLFEMDEEARTEQTPSMLVELGDMEEENGTGQIGERFALITYKQGPDFRSGHFLSIYYLAWIDGNLAILDDKIFPDYLEISTFSNEDFLQLKRSGELLAAPAVLVTSGPTWQGCGYKNTEIIALVDQGPRKVASVQTKYSNFFGNNDNETIGVIRRGVPGQWFSVSYTGTINRSVNWHRSGGAYSPGSLVDLGSC